MCIILYGNGNDSYSPFRQKVAFHLDAPHELCSEVATHRQRAGTGGRACGVRARAAISVQKIGIKIFAYLELAYRGMGVGVVHFISARNIRFYHGDYTV